MAGLGPGSIMANKYVERHNAITGHSRRRLTLIGSNLADLPGIVLSRFLEDQGDASCLTARLETLSHGNRSDRLG
jgi:hypothetical protein